MNTAGVPLISVVLPVRDGATYIHAALTSLVSQTLADIEILVIENGSTDDTSRVVAELSADDDRIVLVNAGEIGLVAALNLGMEMARGEFVARMDADDVSYPDRLERQVASLVADPSICAVGTGYRFVDSSGRELSTRRVATRSDDIAASLPFGNPLAHPTLMFVPARLAAPLRYSDSYRDAEDFELWVRLTRTHRIGSLEDVLLDHRVHDAAVSSSSTHAFDSCCAAFVASAPWPAGRSRWLFEHTFNAGQRGTGFVPFVAAVLLLNFSNLHEPMFHRTALFRRSTLAVASVVRRRAVGVWLRRKDRG